MLFCAGVNRNLGSGERVGGTKAFLTLHSARPVLINSKDPANPLA